MPGERTESASPRRKQKAQDEGDRARSRDLLQAAGVLAGAFTLGQVAVHWASNWKSCLIWALALSTAPLSRAGDATDIMLRLRQIVVAGICPFAWILVAIAGATFFVGAAQNGGVSFHPNALEPKWTRINPGSNLKNIFSTRAISRLGKSLVPVIALMTIAFHKLLDQKTVPLMGVARLPLVFRDSYALLLDAAWLMFAWAVIDYFVERRSWEKRMRMSKQEIREEYKESEGNPQLKGRIRSLQRQMRRRKIKADVSRASVVITNPSHYAVALSFDFGTMDAPKVLAKGRDLFAEQIKAEARWAGVPIMENPPLARSLYRSVEPGQSIPFGLYAAVAGILAYLYRQNVEERMRKEMAAQQRVAVRQTSTAAPDDRGVRRSTGTSQAATHEQRTVMSTANGEQA